jgi:hypothetical protein
MRRHVDYPMTIGPSLTQGNRFEFPANTVKLTVSLGRGGAILFIFFSGDNPAKYTDTDGNYPQSFLNRVTNALPSIIKNE